jgi:hypothetical protein
LGSKGPNAGCRFLPVSPKIFKIQFPEIPLTIFAAYLGSKFKFSKIIPFPKEGEFSENLPSGFRPKVFCYKVRVIRI